MFKSIYKILFLIFVIFSIISVSDFVYSVGNSLPITQLPVSQIKDDVFAVDNIIVGNMDSPQTKAKFTTDGWAGLGLPITGSTEPTASLDVRGLIRLSDLKQSGSRVCANKDGDITGCNFEEFYYGKNCFGSCTTQSTFHKFKVPTGVTQITVELWGSGAMGYFDGSSSSNDSPDSSQNCLVGGGHYCPDGGSTFFMIKMILVDR